MEPTDELLDELADAHEAARRAYWEARDADAGEGGLTAAEHERVAQRQAMAAALAVVERSRSDANGLTRGAAAARRIADRYGDKGEDRTRADWRMWTAMSAGARAVAVRLTELADAEEAP